MSPPVAASVVTSERLTVQSPNAQDVQGVERLSAEVTSRLNVETSRELAAQAVERSSAQAPGVPDVHASERPNVSTSSRQNTQHSEHPSVEAIGRLNDKTPRSQAAQAFERPSAQASDAVNVQTSERPIVSISEQQSTGASERRSIETLEGSGALVSGHSDVQTYGESGNRVQQPPPATVASLSVGASERSNVSTPVPAGSSFVQRKRDGAVRKRMTIYLTPEMAKSLAMRSVVTDRDMSELVEEALSLFLSKP